MTMPDAASNQSRAFYRAALRCNEFREVPTGHLQFLEVPSLVLYAFSIEVGLKALALAESIEGLRGHDLKALFGALPTRLQAEIVAASSAGDVAQTEGFAESLELVRDVFEVWRYVYEKHPVDTDLGFLQRFARGVQSVLFRSDV